MRRAPPGAHERMIAGAVTSCRMFRLLRIAVIALGFAVIFMLSQQATLAREGETAPGILWAIGSLSLLFLLRAAVTERVRGPDFDLQKDILWGLGAGGLLGVALRVSLLGA